jgi:NitT/TauT family transport system substrate-binding protein
MLRRSYNLFVGAAGSFIAEAKNLFEEAGVELEFSQINSTAEGLNALIAGKIDVTGTTLDTAVMLKHMEDKENPFKVFYVNDLSHGADGIVANSSVKSVVDLKGKKIAVTIGSVNHYLLNYALSKNGLKETDVKLVNVAADLIVSAYSSGSVDAAVTWEPFLSEARSTGGSIIFSSRETPELIMGVLVTTQKVIDTRAGELKKLIEGLDAGMRYFHTNKQEGFAITAQKLGTTTEKAAEMMEGIKLFTSADSQRLLDKEVYKIITTIRDMSDFFIKTGIIKESVDPDQLISNVLLNK